MSPARRLTLALGVLGAVLLGVAAVSLFLGSARLSASAVLAALGKTDLFRTHEVPRVKAVLDTLAVF